MQPYSQTTENDGEGSKWVSTERRRRREWLKSRCECVCIRRKGARHVCVLERLIGAE